MKYTPAAYFHLALVTFNTFFVFQMLLSLLTQWFAAEQWALTIGNFVLIIFGFLSLKRKTAEHFAKDEATIYQFLFFTLFAASGIGIAVLLISNPITFLIFMPFEFFIMLFFIAYYFLLTRYILPHKTTHYA